MYNCYLCSQSVFRTASRDEELELVSRVQILHIIELRAAGWVTNDNMVNYYKQRLSHMENTENRMSRDSPQVNNVIQTFLKIIRFSIPQICHTAPSFQSKRAVCGAAFERQ